MPDHGHINSVFNMDLDKIEVAPSTSSHSDLTSTGSQSVLTDVQTNFRFTKSPSPDRSRMGSPSNMMRRWSQNVSRLGNRKKSIRDKRTEAFSSQTAFAADEDTLGSTDEIDRLAQEIGQYDYLMQSSACGEHMRMDTIRALPHPLTTKKKIKARLSASVIHHTSADPSGLIKRLKYRVSMVFSYLRSLVRNVGNSTELWYGSLKEIEGHFGSSVGAYFKFLRWLFVLNLVLLVFTFLFIILPQIMYDSIAGTPPINRTVTYLDFLTGEGYLKHSIMFYGVYTNNTFSTLTGRTYSLPQAYFMTMMCLYILTFTMVSSSMARSYRKSFIETSGGLRNMCAHKIFCSWDFGISNMKAANVKHASIYHELKQVINEIRGSGLKLTKLWRMWTFCSQVTAHFLIGTMLAGLGTAIWILLQQFGEEEGTSSWETLYLPISVTVTILCFQVFFSWIARVEDYKSARRMLHITLLRNFILEAVIVGVLIVFWLSKDHTECWEDSIGQEIYRFIIVDFFIAIVATSLLHFIRVNIVSQIWPSVGKPEFDISQTSLGLVFNQTLLWVGLMFSPFLAIVVVIKMVLTFYIKKLTLIHLCKPPSQIWRSAQTQTLYLVMTFLSLLGVIVALGYIITQVPVSQKCGPFRGHDFMFQIFIEGVLELKSNHWTWRALIAIARPAVIGGVLLTMAVMVYYLRSKSRARQVMVKLLKEMLYLEAKDKEFLLSNITRITQNREWLYDDDELKGHFGRDNFAEQSSTWKYHSASTEDDTLRRRM